VLLAQSMAFYADYRVIEFKRALLEVRWVDSSVFALLCCMPSVPGKADWIV